MLPLPGEYGRNDTEVKPKQNSPEPPRGKEAGSKQVKSVGHPWCLVYVLLAKYPSPLWLTVSPRLSLCMLTLLHIQHYKRGAVLVFDRTS